MPIEAFPPHFPERFFLFFFCLNCVSYYLNENQKVLQFVGIFATYFILSYKAFVLTVNFSRSVLFSWSLIYMFHDTNCEMAHSFSVSVCMLFPININFICFTFILKVSLIEHCFKWSCHWLTCTVFLLFCSSLDL